MDDESGESTEPMEEVPLKELGETESGVSRGIPDGADCVFRISGGGLVTNVACKQSRLLKTNSYRECAVEIALTRSTFQPKMH